MIDPSTANGKPAAQSGNSSMISFNNWASAYQMFRFDNGLFAVQLNLPNGSYEYKYRVNNTAWTTSQETTTKLDANGNLNNILHLDVSQYVHENLVR